MLTVGAAAAAIGIAGILFYEKASNGPLAIPEVRAITETIEAMAYESLKAPCSTELARLCRAASTAAQSSACLVEHRDGVSPACEVAIRNRFGGKPFKEPTLYGNVLLPVGSRFFYDDHGEILGAITTGPTLSRGIEYKAGQIYFNRTGISVGELAHDQTFNGIKYAANGLSLFLHDNDQVETAVLAEDTSIEGHTYKGGTQIHFYQSGKVFMGHLADTGEFVAYNEDGSRKPTEPTIRPFDFVLVDSSATKPLCATGGVPTFECLPQRFANLPPDPGAAGKATIDGVDADKDGVRDDVQRYIALNWGHSPLAVKSLTIVAQQGLRAVHYGDGLGKERTRELFAAKTMQESACSVDLETEETVGARRKVSRLVRNTPERQARSDAWDMMFANGVYPGFEGDANAACGFDVDAMAAAEGKQTISSKLRAINIEEGKRRMAKEEAQRNEELK